MRLSDGDKYIFDFQVIYNLCCTPLFCSGNPRVFFSTSVHLYVAKLSRRKLVEGHYFSDQTAHHISNRNLFQYSIYVNLRERTLAWSNVCYVRHSVL